MVEGGEGEMPIPESREPRLDLLRGRMVEARSLSSSVMYRPRPSGREMVEAGVVMLLSWTLGLLFLERVGSLSGSLPPLLPPLPLRFANA